MANWKDITKEQFDAAYNKHLPNKYIKWMFAHFSRTTEKKNMVIRNYVTFVLLTLFGVGFFFTAFGGSRFIIALVTYLYGGILAAIVLNMFVAAKLNNFRLNKIAKELGVSKTEYDNLAAKY